MLRQYQKATLKSVRYLTSPAKRSVLLQDKDKIPEHRLRERDSPSNRPRVYVWGFAETGALGISTVLKKTDERHTALVHHPTRLKFAENCNVTDIAAGYGFSVFAVNRSDGETLFGTGINTDSQLGLQEKDRKGASQSKRLELLIYPTAIHLPRKPHESNADLQVKCMSAGRAHLIVVTANGTIFTLGNNSFGQCGRQIIPTELYAGNNIIHRIESYNLIRDNDEIVNVECGQDHTLFLTKAGKLLSCGWGLDGQTSRGNFQSTGQIDYVDGDVSREKIVKVSCASDCVLALNDKGEVFGWGNSEYGQLDNSVNNPYSQINLSRHLQFTKDFGKIIDIASGGSFCMILNEDGDVFTWGYGTLGFGPYINQTSTPQKLMPALFGRTDFNPKSRVTSILAGIFHMGAINSDNDLFMWGKNKFGNLGLGHTKDQYFPFKTAINAKILKVSCGVDHNLAICKPFI